MAAPTAGPPPDSICPGARPGQMLSTSPFQGEVWSLRPAAELHAIAPPSVGATHASPLRRRGHVTVWADSLQHQIELQDLVIGDGRVLDAVAGRLTVSTHGIEAIADHAGSKPMARVRHGRKHLPL